MRAPRPCRCCWTWGWSATEIVIPSQLVAFLSFPIRAVVGQPALAAHPASPHCRPHTVAPTPQRPSHKRYRCHPTPATTNPRPSLRRNSNGCPGCRHCPGYALTERPTPAWWTRRATRTTWAHVTASIGTSSTTPTPACLVQSASCLPRPRRAPTAASNARRCARVLPRTSRTPRPMRSACWTRALEQLALRAGTLAWRGRERCQPHHRSLASNIRPPACNGAEPLRYCRRAARCRLFHLGQPVDVAAGVAATATRRVGWKVIPNGMVDDWAVVLACPTSVVAKCASGRGAIPHQSAAMHFA